MSRFAREFDPELVDILGDLDRRGLVVSHDSTQTEMTTHAVLRAETDTGLRSGLAPASPSDRVREPWHHPLER